MEWVYTNKETHIFENPYQLELGFLHDQMYDMGLATEENDNGFEFFFFDIAKVPFKMRVEYYQIEINRIMWEVNEKEYFDKDDVDDLLYNFKKLKSYTIAAIMERHCTLRS